MPQNPPSQFTCFPRLPLELRCAVWKASMEPRVVEINYDLPEGFYSEAHYPHALQVSVESRNSVLPYYPLCFGSDFHPAKTRFNLELDTLYIGESMEDDVPHLFSVLTEREKKGLRYVAVDSYYTGSDLADDDAEEDFIVNMRRAMRRLDGLAELQIIFDVRAMSGRSFGCGEDDHPIEITEKLPTDLDKPKFGICPLPVGAEEYDLWKVKKVTPMYGWRRCPVGFDETEPAHDPLNPWSSPRFDDSDYDSLEDHGFDIFGGQLTDGEYDSGTEGETSDEEAVAYGYAPAEEDTIDDTASLD